MERNFQEELKAAQAKVKQLGSAREKLSGDSRVEQERVKQSVEALTALGVEDADKLSVEDLNKLRAQTQEELEKNLDALKQQIAEGEKLLTEYETASAA